LNRFEIWKRTPANIRAALNIPEPPRARARRPFNLLVGNNRLVVEAAARCAKSLGFKPRVITHQMRGEACEAGKRLAASLRRAKGSACLLMGGETTVAVHGTGRGGRNQELALSAAQALHGLSNVAVMALATDGIDGPTDAAGAVVTGDTVHQALSLGLNPETSIQENNAYPLLDALNALIRTGPSGSNLNDLVVGLTYKKD
jgi:glycerate 2-kinase